MVVVPDPSRMGASSAPLMTTDNVADVDSPAESVTLNVNWSRIESRLSQWSRERLIHCILPQNISGRAIARLIL